MKKGCILSLLLLIVLVAAYYFLISRFYGEPDNWIGSLVVGFMTFFGIGSLMNVRTAFKDFARLNRAGGGAMPIDGEMIAAAGTINPIGAPLKTPFTLQDCCLYEYKVFTEETYRTTSGGSSSTQRRELQAYSGMAMTPSEIRTPTGSIKLLGFPTLEGFGQKFCGGDEVLRNAAAYISSNRFQDFSGFPLGKAIAELKDFMSDDDGTVKKDMKHEKGEIDISGHIFQEEFVTVGQEVCAFGKYSAAKGGLVADLGAGEINRLFKGNVAAIRRTLKGKVITGIIFGIVFLLFGNGALLLAIYNAKPLVNQ